jgi:hypothetical protein
MTPKVIQIIPAPRKSSATLYALLADGQIKAYFAESPIDSGEHWFDVVTPADELSLDPTDAEQLGAWLAVYCLRNNTNRVPTKAVLQYGPNNLRRTKKLEIAVLELAENKRAQFLQEGKRKFIVLNTLALDAAEAE